MSNSEIVINGGGSNSDGVAEPITLSSVIVTIINTFVFLAIVIVWVLAYFTTTIAFTITIWREVSTRMSIWRTEGGLIARPGNSTKWTFEKTAYSWYGSSGVLTIRSDDWTVDVYNETVVWLYWYIPDSRLYNNYFGFEITGYANALKHGESQWNKFYYKSYSLARNVIKVQHQFIQDRYHPVRGISPSDLGMFRLSKLMFIVIVLYPVIIEGQFNSIGRSFAPISIMKLNNMYAPMIHRLRLGELAYFCYCEIPRKYCIKYNNTGVTEETINDFWYELGLSNY